MMILSRRYRPERTNLVKERILETEKESLKRLKKNRSSNPFFGKKRWFCSVKTELISWAEWIPTFNSIPWTKTWSESQLSWCHASGDSHIYATPRTRMIILSGQRSTSHSMVPYHTHDQLLHTPQQTRDAITYLPPTSVVRGRINHIIEYSPVKVERKNTSTWVTVLIHSIIIYTLEFQNSFFCIF